MKMKELALRAGVALLSAICFAPAQRASALETWEAHQFDEVSGFVFHWTLRLHDDGSFDRATLSSNPVQPYAQDVGKYTLSDRQLELISTTGFPSGPSHYSFSATMDTLYGENDVRVVLTKGYDIDPKLMIGVWELYGPDGRPAGSQMTLDDHGAYHYQTDPTGPWEIGPYHIAGSGMVHWPTDTNTPELLGVPGVWGNLQVEGNRMSYSIADGIKISAIRVVPSAVEAVPWGLVKRYH